MTVIISCIPNRFLGKSDAKNGLPSSILKRKLGKFENKNVIRFEQA